MPSFARTLAISALLALANAQGVIQSAKGDSGTSLPLQLDVTNAKDNTFINDAEISTNIVNECGRTLAGNIDVGDSTEIRLAAKQVASVTKSGKLTLTIKEVNAQGAGPFTCDMDLTSNGNGLTGQTKLQTTETSNGGNTIVEATMPADMKCIGGSTGNICTVRCRNAQNFGGCVAVQQTDVTPNVNTPDNIKAAATLKDVTDRQLQDLKDLQIATDANAASSTDQQGANIAAALLKANAAQLAALEKAAGAGGTGGAANNATAGAGNAAKKNNNNAAKKNNAAAAKKNNAAAAKKNNAANAAKNNNAVAAKKNNAAKNNNAAAAADNSASAAGKAAQRKRDLGLSGMRWAKRQTAAEDDAACDDV